MDEPLDVNLEPEGLVIDKDDLTPSHQEILSPRVAPPSMNPPSSRYAPNVVFRGLIGRNIAAVVASVFAAELILHISFRSSTLCSVRSTFLSCALVTALYMAAAAGIIGAGLAAAESFAQGHLPNAAKRCLTGFLYGAAGGFAGGFWAQAAAAFSFSLHPENAQLQAALAGFLSSLLGWGAAGVAIGFGRAKALPSSRARGSIIAGIIGGVLGGLLIGIAADPISSSEAARFSGLLIFGLALGIAFSGMDDTKRDVWFTTDSGPLQGADFILSPGQTRLGKSPDCDIILSGPFVAPIHAILLADGVLTTLTNLSDAYPTFINGRSARSCTLVPGDVVQIGHNLLRYCEKE